jgi:hypothetical protein
VNNRAVFHSGGSKTQLCRSNFSTNVTVPFVTPALSQATRDLGA